MYEQGLLISENKIKIKLKNPGGLAFILPRPPGPRTSQVRGQGFLDYYSLEILDHRTTNSGEVVTTIFYRKIDINYSHFLIILKIPKNEEEDPPN